MDAGDRLRLRRVKAPDKVQLERLVQRLSERVGRCLERKGLLVRDMDNSYRVVEPGEEGGLDPVLGSSITYRIAVGPHQGRKAFTLQTLLSRGTAEADSDRVAKASGFSLHAGVMAEAHERDKLERLCRYITRPALAEARLSVTGQGMVCYQLKTPYRGGITHGVLEPPDFIARLAALVPRPRVNLARYHGVFAPHSAQRARITPGGRRRRNRSRCGDDDPTALERRGAMRWAQRLRRVFGIDVDTCSACGGAMKGVASIEDPHVIDRILAHLDHAGVAGVEARRPATRAPPGS